METVTADEGELPALARSGNEGAFNAVVETHRAGQAPEKHGVDVQEVARHLDTTSLLMFGPDCDRTRGKLISSYDEPLCEHMTALNARIAALGTRTVVSGLGGDEMVAVGAAQSERAAGRRRRRADRRPGHRDRPRHGPGQARGVPHAFWNPADRPACLLEIISPAGFEQYFAGLANSR